MDISNVRLSVPEIDPLEGYILPVNEKTGKQLPDCCEYHKRVFEEAKKGFSKNIAEKIVKQLSYTEYCIATQIIKPDWYKLIIDYIDLNIHGYELFKRKNFYLRNLRYWIDKYGEEKIKSPRQRQSLSEYIQELLKPKENKESGLSILISTYKQWLNLFPFDVKGYFPSLKQHYENQLPIFQGNWETNIYSGLTRRKLHSRSSLIRILVNLTNELLDKINPQELIEQGLISELDTHLEELELASLRAATSQITRDFSSGELEYVNALEKWLNFHKVFFEKKLARFNTEQLINKGRKFNNPNPVSVNPSLVKSTIKSDSDSDKKISYKAIAIACFCMDIHFLDIQQAEAVLEKYAPDKNMVKKGPTMLMRNRIKKVDLLTRITGNLKTDNLHRGTLQIARRCVEGEKSKELRERGLTALDRIIKGFEGGYRNQYQ